MGVVPLPAMAATTSMRCAGMGKMTSGGMISQPIPGPQKLIRRIMLPMAALLLCPGHPITARVI